MAFPRRLLNDFEEIVLDLNPHWLYFAEPAMVLAGVIVLTIGVQAAFDPPDSVTLFLVALILVMVVWVAIRYVKWTTTNFVITTDRMIFRSGIFAKHGIEIPLERVNNVIFRQSFLERLVGAGNLTIESGSEHGQQHFTDIKHPELVQNEIHAQIEHNENRKYDRMRGGAPTDAPLPPPPPAVPAHDVVASQLERLAELRAKGILSQAEFAA